jgi:hypothetical protein
MLIWTATLTPKSNFVSISLNELNTATPAAPAYHILISTAGTLTIRDKRNIIESRLHVATSPAAEGPRGFAKRSNAPDHQLKCREILKEAAEHWKGQQRACSRTQHLLMTKQSNTKEDGKP